MRWDTVFSVFEFQEVLNTTFYIDEILQYFRIKKTDYTIKKVRDYLIKKNIAFLKRRNDLYNWGDTDFAASPWILKTNFLKDKIFAIRPSRFEIENNILLLGSRFSWFLNNDFAYNNLIAYYDKLPVQRSFFLLPYSQAQYYFFTEGETQFFNDILNQHDDNFESFSVMTTNANVKLKCFLMYDVYRDLQIMEGDRLLFRFSNNGKFGFEILDKKALPVSKEKEQYLQKKFDDTMYHICRSLKAESNPFTVLSTVFFFENKTLFTDMQLSFEELIQNSKTICCIEYGYESLIWLRDEPEPDNFFWAMVLDRDDTRQEQLFYRMAIPLSAFILDLIITKFLYDDFAYGNADEKALYETLSKTFLDWNDVKKKDYDAFFDLVKKRRDEIKKTFNPFAEANELVEMRNTVLGLYLQMVAFVGTLCEKNFSPSSFVNQQGIRLNQLLSKIVVIADFFSVRYASYMEFTELIANVENMAEGFEMVKSSIEVQIKNNGSFYE